MYPDSGTRPSRVAQVARVTRPEGSEVNLSLSQSGAEGRPPVAPFSAMLACFLVSGMSFFVGSTTDLVVLQLIGFLVGSFASVVALAWFVVQDNLSRSLPYRDWRISAKGLMPWLLTGSWLLGTANVFLLALDVSRRFVE